MADDPPRHPRKILFACTHNAVRSPMAVGIARATLPTDVACDSVGTLRGREVDPLAVAAMAEIGVDIARHHPLSFTDLESGGGDVGGYDVIVALSKAAEEAAREVARFAPVAVEVWPIPDPTRAEPHIDGDPLTGYRATREALSNAIAARFRDADRRPGETARRDLSG